MALAPLLAILSGAAVGFSLGLIGGGGSILAVPLLLYLVGIPDAHVAIGTSALAVAVNAFATLYSHARAGTVRWHPALIFGIAGAAGAAVGSTLGKLMPGQQLIFLFALVMIAAGIAMLRRHEDSGPKEAPLDRGAALRLAAVGFGTGALSGFFGIGGGFLIVPGLLWAARMAMINAIGSSLFSVGAFGLTTAVNYALSGLVDWEIAAEFLVGGAAGGYFGMMLAVRLAHQRRTLTYIFVAVVFAAAAYMIVRTGLPFG